MKQEGLFDQDPRSQDLPVRAGQVRSVAFRPNFEGFRTAAKDMLAGELAPDQIWWVEDPTVDTKNWSDDIRHRVPMEFVRRAKFVACHQAPDRWSLLYQILWRLTHGEPHLMSLSGDKLISRLHRYDQSVHRELHKMKAFVRFKKTTDDAGDRFVAWFEPEHHIIELAAQFFIRRFTNMRWSLLTPVGCAHWEGGGKPVITEGLTQSTIQTDALEQFWQVYYRNIFNPARVKTDAMRAEMPQKYWKHLPEAAAISDLLVNAETRLDRMLRAEPAPATLHCGERPAAYHQTLRQTIASSHDPGARIEAGVRACADCRLSEQATQAVPGEGPADANVMLVGEQPGDHEDLAGRPFVGPAGQLLNSVLAELDIKRDELYLTNAVKHFKFRVSGKRRLHERPRDTEILACRSWLTSEIEAVDPKLIICLGVTAATSVFGRKVSLKETRGKVFELDNRLVLVTLHPAAILRSADTSSSRQQLVNDLKVARKNKHAFPP